MPDSITQTSDTQVTKPSAWRWVVLLACLFVGLTQLNDMILSLAKRGSRGQEWVWMRGSLGVVPWGFILFRTVSWWRREEGKARWVFYSVAVFAWPIGMRLVGAAFPWLMLR